MTTPGVESARIIALERAVIVSGGVVGGLAAGVSASLGFFLKPITEALGFGREVIGLATGLSFFLNGFAAIGWGAVADTRGAALRWNDFPHGMRFSASDVDAFRVLMRRQIEKAGAAQAAGRDGGVESAPARKRAKFGRPSHE